MSTQNLHQTSFVMGKVRNTPFKIRNKNLIITDYIWHCGRIPTQRCLKKKKKGEEERTPTAFPDGIIVY